MKQTNKQSEGIKLVGIFIILIFINGCEKEVPLIEQKPTQIEPLFEGIVAWDESHPNYYRKQAYCTIDELVVWTDGCNCYGCKKGSCWSTFVGCYRTENYTWDGNLTGTHWLEIEEAKERGLI